MGMKTKLRMSSIPSRDVFVLRDIVHMILGDDELRKGFRKAVASTAEMRRAVTSLNTACNAYIDEDLNMNKCQCQREKERERGLGEYIPSCEFCNQNFDKKTS